MIFLEATSTNTGSITQSVYTRSWTRAFSTLASALAVISFSHGIFYNMPFWLILRFFSGFGTAGIFVVIVEVGIPF